MPNFLSKYDAEKGRKMRNKYRKKNYQKSTKYPRRPWTPEEDNIVLEHKLTDRELSEKIQRSVQSIQTRRSKLKNKNEKNKV